MDPMTTPRVTTQLMFEGKAEEAMNFYASVFSDARIVRIQRYKAGEAGPEGSVMHAHFDLRGHALTFIDSPAKHAFTFTPSISFFIECESAEEQQRAFEMLSEGGQVYMPLDNYGFSTRFGWCGDRYGVTWQLNLR
jgi:predicted 3-demethylubiquinone-9 3-methyltransferase (glyoxalase superfamily)